MMALADCACFNFFNRDLGANYLADLGALRPQEWTGPIFLIVSTIIGRDVFKWYFALLVE
jgi:hypothetical protein